MAAGLWPERFLAEIQDLCVTGDLLSDLSRSLRFGERAGLLQWMAVEGAGIQFDFGSNGVPGSFGLIPSGWIDQERAFYARLFQPGLEGLDPTRQRLDVAAIEAGDGFREQAKRRQPSFHGMIATLMVPGSLAKVYQTTARNQTWLNQAFLACALERHRAAHGRYPESLAALVPQFAAKLPHDILDGQPLRYRRAEDGKYLLYSVGWNSRDDGGIAGQRKPDDSDRDDSEQLDWVWQGVPSF